MGKRRDKPPRCSEGFNCLGCQAGPSAQPAQCLGADRAGRHPEELSRTRARWRAKSWSTSRRACPGAPRLFFRQIPRDLSQALERDAALVRTGLSAAGAYGWDELTRQAMANTWSLDACLPAAAFGRRFPLGFGMYTRRITGAKARSSDTASSRSRSAIGRRCSAASAWSASGAASSGQTYTPPVGPKLSY